MKNELERRQDAHAVYPLINNLQKFLIDLNFPLPLKYDKERFFVRFDNIWLGVDSEYYLKNNHESQSIGSMLSNLLKQFNITPSIIIDIGANEGECSLRLINNYPLCKIYSVEPSTRTFQTLAANCAVQEFDTSNLILSNLAISNNDSDVSITCGKAQENALITDTSLLMTDYEIVSGLTLSSYIKIMGLRGKIIDCIKIDIEGYEPFLYDSLAECLPKVRSLLIECSKKTPLEDYMKLFNLLIDSNFKIITNWGRSSVNNSSELNNYLLDLMWSDNSDCGAVDIFFIKN